MSYVQHTWQNDELITAAKLNNLEEGVAAGGGGGSSSILFVTNDDGTLDKTWQEIYDAMTSSVLCVVIQSVVDEVEGFASITSNIIQNIVLQEGVYSLYLDDGLPFIASTANDYPVVSD